MELVITLLVGGFVTLVIGALMGIVAHRRTRQLAARLDALEEALLASRPPRAGATPATRRADVPPEPTAGAVAREPGPLPPPGVAPTPGSASPWAPPWWQRPAQRAAEP